MLKNPSFKVKLFAFLRIYTRYTVSGDSMLPVLSDGDIVYVKKTTHVTVGDIVVAHHPFRKRTIVKHVAQVTETGVLLRGLNDTESEDSTVFGILPWSDVIGEAVAKD